MTILLNSPKSLPLGRLSLEVLREIIEEMVRSGNAEWLDANEKMRRRRGRVLLLWKSPSEWAERLYKHVCDTGQTGSIVTVYELFMSEESIGQDFHGLPEPMWRRIISVLEAQGKAKLFASDEAELDSEAGVKFF